MEAKEARRGRQQDDEVCEPGGRKRQPVNEMSDEALAAAYGDGVRFRSHGLSSVTDDMVAWWLREARAELKERGKLQLVKESLPVYFDPSRRPAVFGPGAETVNQSAIERAIVPPALKSAG